MGFRKRADHDDCKICEHSGHLCAIKGHSGTGFVELFAHLWQDKFDTAPQFISKRCKAHHPCLSWLVSPKNYIFII